MSYKALIKDIGLIPLLLLIVFLLNPFSLAHYIGYFIPIYLLTFWKGRFLGILDIESTVLLIFSLIYSAFDFLTGSYHERGIQLLLVQTIFPFFFYGLGKCLISSKMSQRDIFILTIFLAIVFSLAPIATVLSDLMTGGFSQINRDFKSIWDGTSVLATGIAGYLIYNTSYPIFVISRNKILKPIERLVLLIIFLTTLFGFLRVSLV